MRYPFQKYDKFDGIQCQIKMTVYNLCVAKCNEKRWCFIGFSVVSMYTQYKTGLQYISLLLNARILPPICMVLLPLAIDLIAHFCSTNQSHTTSTPHAMFTSVDAL